MSALVVNAATAENVAVCAGDAYAGEVCVGVGAGAASVHMLVKCVLV